MGHAAIAQRRAAGPVRDQNGVLGSGNLLVVDGQRLHQLHGVDALLIPHAAKIMEGQSRERHDRRPVECRIVETIHQMDRARSGRADADAETAGVFGPSGGHEGCGFFMPNGDVTDPILALSQRFDNRIDAVADDPENMGRAPVDHRLDEDIRGIDIRSGIQRGLRGDTRFRLGSLRGRRCARSRGGEPDCGGCLKEAPAIPPGNLVAAHMTNPKLV
jgi:hypothetical protein